MQSNRPIRHRLIGQSAEFLRAVHTARMIGGTDATVLIHGESGVGKECFASVIHDEGTRAGKPFITLNCAAIPDSLLEAELFGYRRGAFTGADSHQSGHIVNADGGTLFLDEVAELSLAAQGKLLRFLETQQVQPLGAAESRTVDVRLIAATNRDLRDEVERGVFRSDLYYRLNVVPLEVPALRERRDDILDLLDHFTAESAAKHGLQAPIFEPAARKLLKHHTWPGNVRELRNLSERMVVLFAGRQVQVANLPEEVSQPRRSADPGSLFKLPSSGIDLNRLEESVLRQALDMSAGNRSAAARLLGISRDTLLYRLKKFAIDF
ncbi:MAG: sigma-54 interaction domain-containing protein [Gammaproteobacteria bacterium]